MYVLLANDQYSTTSSVYDDRMNKSSFVYRFFSDFLTAFNAVFPSVQIKLPEWGLGVFGIQSGM